MSFNQDWIKEYLNEKMATKLSNKYRCHEIRKELYEIIKICDGEKFFVFKKLADHFGKIISSDEKSFAVELRADSNFELLNQINCEGHIKVLEKKRKTPDAELCIVFIYYR